MKRTYRIIDMTAEPKTEVKVEAHTLHLSDAFNEMKVRWVGNQSEDDVVTISIDHLAKIDVELCKSGKIIAWIYGRTAAGLRNFPYQTDPDSQAYTLWEKGGEKVLS